MAVATDSNFAWTDIPISRFLVLAAYYQYSNLSPKLQRDRYMEGEPSWFNPIDFLNKGNYLIDGQLTLQALEVLDSMDLKERIHVCIETVSPILLKALLLREMYKEDLPPFLAHSVGWVRDVARAVYEEIKE